MAMVECKYATPDLESLNPAIWSADYCSHFSGKIWDVQPQSKFTTAFLWGAVCPRNAWTKRRSDDVVLLWDKLLAQQPRRLCERFPWFYLGHTSTKFYPQRFGIPVPTSNGRYLVTCCTNDVGMMGIHFKLSQTAHGDLSRLETYTPQLPPGHRQPTMSKSLAEYKQPPDATGIHCRKIGYPKNLRINLTLLSSSLLDGNCETGMAITISCAVVDSISGATNAENNINQWFNHPTYQLLSSTLKPSETKYIIYIWDYIYEMITRNNPAM